MRNVLILVLLCFCFSLTGNTYYVSTTGSNNNSGTQSSPFATINKAWSVVSAGDIIYVRGGTYTYSMMGQTVLSGKSGTSGNMITIQSYPGESPVINFSANNFTSQVIGIAMQNANYIRLKGLRITSINQPHDGSAAQYGMMLWDHVSNCIFEQVQCDHIGGWGTTIGDWCNDNLWLNCDGDHNSDPYTTGGNPHYGWSDGFQSASWNQTSGQASTRNIFRNCRAYSNSDDGWDLRRCEGIWTFENCWSFWNGYIPGEKLGDSDSRSPGGDGDGYKIGGNYGKSTTEIRRTLVNCLSVENKLTSFDGWNDIGSSGANPGGYVGIHIYNCISYNNGVVGFGFSDPAGASTTELRNNISYRDAGGTGYWTSPAWWAHDHNSWDIPLTVTDADFASVSSSGMDASRLTDGSLPNSNVLHLASGSKFIDAGVNVGMTYSGNLPDLGAFEYTSGSPVTIQVPVFQSSAVESAVPSIIEMTYDINLNNLIVPSVSSFTVTVNSAARTVSSVTISGAKIKLTISGRIVAGENVTVSYTKPSTNPIQTTTGGTAISISSQQVVNKCINLAPTATITSPLSNSSFIALGNITITASALDTDGSISLVEFYNGNTKIGSKSSAPFTFIWNNVTAGSYSISVTATDNLNAKTSSSSLSISVVNPVAAINLHPIVKILNPAKGTKLENLSSVSIGAIASDPDGLVSKVEFYNGSVKLVELTSAPYDYIWKNVVPGKYSITAIATDNLNDTTISLPVEFEVGSIAKYDVNSDIIKLYPNPNNGRFSIEFINPLQTNKSEIIITDLSGKQVYSSPVLKEETVKHIDFSASRSGIYVILIKDKEIMATKKFIKN